MSLYNMLNGVNPATFFILPMLGEKHPDEYPRFRDCFVENNQIHVYTRVGGGNRDCGYGEDELQAHPNYIEDFDDDFDSTYATYVFSVPEEFKADFDLLMNGTLSEGLPNTSDKYKERILKVYPKIEDKLLEMFEKK